jgi:beta-glucosidase
MKVEGSYLGTYYSDTNNQHLVDGTEKFRKYDNILRITWTQSSPPGPDLTNEHFSVRWTNRVYLTAGSHTFTTSHDDGERVYLRNILVYDSWKDQPSTSHIFTVNVANTGWYDIMIEYYQSTGKGSVNLTWN